MEKGNARDGKHCFLYLLESGNALMIVSISFPFSSLLVLSLRSLLHSSSPASERKRLGRVREESELG